MHQRTSTERLGAHVSVQGGVDRAPVRGHAIGATAIQVFTKTPVKTVDDLKKIKLYTSAGNDRMVQWFKANGFEPRAMAMTDIMTGLTTGMIEGLPAPKSEVPRAVVWSWSRDQPRPADRRA